MYVFTEVMSGLPYLIGSEALGEDVQTLCTAKSLRARFPEWQDCRKTNRHSYTQVHSKDQMYLSFSQTHTKINSETQTKPGE